MKYQFTIQELRSTVAGRDMAIDEKNLQIAELRSDIVDLKRDVVQMGNAISFKNVRLKNKQAVINRLKEQISRLESTYDSMYSAMLEDNQAIMKDLKESQQELKLLHGVRLQTPSVGTRIVSKVDAPLTVSERAMEAVQLIVECGINRDTWVLYTNDDARDAMRSKQLIDELNETIKDLRMAAGDMLDKHGDRARKAELCKKEINRLRRILGTADKEINELSSQYCDRCDQLEKIEKLTTDAISYVHIDDIRKILMEK